MVSALARSTVGFCFPLGPEPLSLGRVTDRAVALIPILAIKLMSVLAVRSHGITSCDGVGVDKTVLTNCNHSQMRYIHTVSILAHMVDDHAGSNRPISHKEGDSVRSTVLLTEVKEAVAILVERTPPKVTPIFGCPLAIKSFLFCRSHHIPSRINLLPGNCNG